MVKDFQAKGWLLVLSTNLLHSLNVGHARDQHVLSQLWGAKAQLQQEMPLQEVWLMPPKIGNTYLDPTYYTF